jgi:ABC-type Mn2+/Zn2+ transport system permease subunit
MSGGLERFLHPFALFARTYVATFLIALVCGYLGIFIALKRIAFVGVALAEISAAGMAAAFYALTLAGVGELGHAELFRYAVLAGSVLFSFGGVVLFSAPLAERKISREAVIGVAYATAAGLSILLVWKSAQGLEELKNVLSGSVLFVDQGQIATLAAMGGAVALVHVLFWKEFVFSSFDPVMARTLGLAARGYDLLLFVTIGTAIAVSLRTGGVLMVFGFLVIPAQGGLLLGSRLGPAFLHAMAQAAIAAAAGLYASDAGDLPTGPTIIVAQAVLLVASALAARAPRLVRGAAVAAEAAGGLAAAGLAAFSLAVSLGWVQADFEAPHFAEPETVAPAAPAPPTAPAPKRGPEEMAALLRDLGSDDDETRDAALEAIVALRDPAAAPSLVKALDGAGPAWRIHLAIALARLGSARGVEVLVEALEGDATPFDRSEALDALRAIAGGDFGYDPEKSAGEQKAAIERWKAWWRDHRGALRWDRKTGKLSAEPH